MKRVAVLVCFWYGLRLLCLLVITPTRAELISIANRDKIKILIKLSFQEFYSYFHTIIITTTMKTSDNIIVHSTSDGKLFIEEKEFFASEKVQNIVKKLLNSSVYKGIKSDRISDIKK